MDVLTLDRAKELAQEVVTEFGADYKYPIEHKRDDGLKLSCVYVHDGKPSCLVGQILYRHGVSLESLAQYEFSGAGVMTYQVTEAENDAVAFLDVMQYYQDSGQTWGNALEAGLEY